MLQTRRGSSFIEIDQYKTESRVFPATTRESSAAEQRTRGCVCRLTTRVKMLAASASGMVAPMATSRVSSGASASATQRVAPLAGRHGAFSGRASNHSWESPGFRHASPHLASRGRSAFSSSGSRWVRAPPCSEPRVVPPGSRADADLASTARCRSTRSSASHSGVVERSTAFFFQPLRLTFFSPYPLTSSPCATCAYNRRAARKSGVVCSVRSSSPSRRGEKAQLKTGKDGRGKTVAPNAVSPPDADIGAWPTSPMRRAPHLFSERPPNFYFNGVTLAAS